MVRRIVDELREFDNVYYEVCNEPYITGIPQTWQDHMAGVIADVEKDFSQKHLISQNVANHKATVERPHPAISIFNFHYAWLPETMDLNYRLNKVIGDNETGFRGIADGPYRREAWEFILAGGGLFSNLDYSFTVGHEDGSFVLPANQWGGGSPALREQIRHLKEFIEGFDFVRMTPDNGVVRSGTVSAPVRGGVTPVSVRALVERGRQYAIYTGGVTKAVTLEVDLPPGDYTAQWLHPSTGRTEPLAAFSHTDGVWRFECAKCDEDLALGIRRKNAEKPSE
jgi:hypothetical protein